MVEKGVIQYQDKESEQAKGTDRVRRELEGKRDTQGKSMRSLWMATIKLAIEKEGEFGYPVGH